MRSLTPDFRFDETVLDDKISLLEKSVKPEKIDFEVVREKLVSDGVDIKFSVEFEPENVKTVLGVDSSFGKLDLKFHSIYGVHTVCVAADYTGRDSQDTLVGQGTIPYENLLYESKIDLGVFEPYSDTEFRLNLIRISEEIALLKKAGRECEKEVLRIVDGSIHCISKDLNKPCEFQEFEKARSAYDEIMEDKVVSMVEDSHETDFASLANVKGTNLYLFDNILKPKEYVVKEEAGIHIVYLKLPGKNLCFKPNENSPPLTVRWEFNYPDFQKDLNFLISAWAREDDIFHPQLYPVRIADYLTRRIRIHGLLEEFAKKGGLELQHRNLREYLFSETNF
ncbi:MAG: DNA double-strand break repair nuclease NurA [Methanobacteriota archaeon]